MRKSLLTLVPGMIAVFVASAAAADDAALAKAIRAGHAIASETCVICHVVPGQTLPPLYGGRAPSFESIANKPGATAGSLHRFLDDTHWDDPIFSQRPIPMTSLSETEKVEIIAYILNLRHMP